MSLDEFQDISERLDAMNVAYVLAVGIPGQKCTHVWSNGGDFDGGNETLAKAVADHLADEE